MTLPTGMNLSGPAASTPLGFVQPRLTYCVQSRNFESLIVAA